MPATIPPIAPPLSEWTVTVIGSMGTAVDEGGGVMTAGEDNEEADVGADSDDENLAVVISVASEATGIDVAIAAVDVTTTTDDQFMLAVVTGGASTNVVGLPGTSPSLGRYGSQTEGILSQPDLPTW